MKKTFLCLFSIIVLFVQNNSYAAENWQAINAKIKKDIFQINVGLKLKLKHLLWVQVTDLSPKEHYYVFSTSTDDKGYRVVGHGTAFRLATKNNVSNRFFVTSNHVLDNAQQITDECEMFYCAMQLYAEKTTQNGNVAARFSDLLRMINEKKEYEKTVDAIWNCYDQYLSERTDPGRILFEKYKKIISIEPSTSYFLHNAAENKVSAIEAKVYKKAKNNEPDLAILKASSPAAPHLSNGLLLEDKAPFVGQQIQIIGYPNNSNNNYIPVISSGRITKTDKYLFEVDTPISKGESGSPVIGISGKVIGIVSVRGIVHDGRVISKNGGAIYSRLLKDWAKSLF